MITSHKNKKTDKCDDNRVLIKLARNFLSDVPLHSEITFEDVPHIYNLDLLCRLYESSRPSCYCDDDLHKHGKEIIHQIAKVLKSVSDLDELWRRWYIVRTIIRHHNKVSKLFEDQLVILLQESSSKNLDLQSLIYLYEFCDSESQLRQITEDYLVGKMERMLPKIKSRSHLLGLFGDLLGYSRSNRPCELVNTRLNELPETDPIDPVMEWWEKEDVPEEDIVNMLKRKLPKVFAPPKLTELWRKTSPFFKAMKRVDEQYRVGFMNGLSRLSRGTLHQLVRDCKEEFPESRLEKMVKDRIVELLQGKSYPYQIIEGLNELFLSPEMAPIWELFEVRLIEILEENLHDNFDLEELIWWSEDIRLPSWWKEGEEPHSREMIETRMKEVIESVDLTAPPEWLFIIFRDRRKIPDCIQELVISLAQRILSEADS